MEPEKWMYFRTEQNRNFICKDLYIYTSSYKTFNTRSTSNYSVLVSPCAVSMWLYNRPRWIWI